jgi:hypothetical protein
VYFVVRQLLLCVGEGFVEFKPGDSLETTTKSPLTRHFPELRHLFVIELFAHAIRHAWLYT